MIHKSGMEINRILYDKLKGIAKQRKRTHYEDVAPLVNLNLDTIKERNELADILGKISTYEHEEGRPMLSAVVLRKDTDMPGSGFFELARELGLLTSQNEKKFFYDEIKKVWDCWNKC